MEKIYLRLGMIVGGTVKSIQPYGVFIQIYNGVTGLLYTEDISISRIKTPKERFKIGQKVNVMIKCINKNNGRINLTYKELLGTWEDNIKCFSEGDIVEGIVRDTEKQKNGIFIELKPNLVGLADYKENAIYGDKVHVEIKKIIPEKKKVKLVFV